MESFEIQTTFPVSAKVLYNAWLDSKTHSAMTGTQAEIDPSPEGVFRIFGGYITGKNVELVPGEKIVQRWRTSEFPVTSPDSVLKVIFEKMGKSTKIIIRHTKIPEGQAKDYRQGWKEYYFRPMKSFFGTSMSISG